MIPVTGSGDLLDAKAALNRGYTGLSGWMRVAEKVWRDNAEKGGMTLIDRWNYHNELGAQFPLTTLRVVYAKAGTLPAASIVRDDAVIDRKLYWARPRNKAEGEFLIAILNCGTARARVSALQSRGQWGARDFDKVMFTLPIPQFDAKNPLHTALASAAEEAESLAAAVPLPEGVKFQRARKLVRDALADAGISQKIDALVARLLDGK